MSSDGTDTNKTKQVKQKLEHELQQTKKWECNWKIKTSTNKCKASTIGTTPSILRKYGGINVDNESLSIASRNKILGYNFNNMTKGTAHVQVLLTKARYNSNRIRRFQTAPQKVKLALFKTLIRPILEYPPNPLTKVSINNKINMQIIQNHGLRYVKGLNLSRS